MRSKLSPLRRRALRAYDRWQAAAGPWARWTICLPLLGPGLDELDARGTDALGRGVQGSAANPVKRRGRASPPTLQWSVRAQPLRARQWRVRLKEGPPSDVRARTVVILDFPPEVGVPIAAELARAGHARPLLVIGRWPYAEAVLPARPLVDLTIAETRGLRDLDAPHLVIVLDGDRAKDLPRRPASDARVDNRYEVVREDFPDASTLLAAGFHQVRDVRPPGTSVPPLMANGVYATWAAAGLLVVTP